jgi:branched-chain amino acid transport system ATP-binding protein
VSPTDTAGAPTASPTSAPLLECAGIQAGYEKVTILRHFDLTADAGTVVAILGPNGAGKTTLLTTLAGLLPAQAGTVSLAGQPLKNGRPAATSRAGLVLVPDDRALFRTLNVEENLKAARGKRKTTIDSVIDLFPQLGTRRKVAAGNLSGGEQQMLAVARALMQEPRVLLLDEMSMGLAPVIVEELLPMVRRIADQTNAVVVLVEQHVTLALEIADRAMVLVHGEVQLDRPAEQLRADPTILEAAYLGEALHNDSPTSNTTNGQSSSTSISSA